MRENQSEVADNRAHSMIKRQKGGRPGYEDDDKREEVKAVDEPY